jgi:hypothetical protein
VEEIRMRRIQRVFEDRKIDDIPDVVSQEFKRIRLDEKIRPGMRVGITVGSRGIRDIQTIIKQTIDEVKKSEGIPLIITSMGSHGGATAEGQRGLLAGYGITEETMGVPIKSSMEVIQLGRLENGLQVYFDKTAFEADGLIVVNRVKVHTGFKSEIESGLHKMLAVGLGNHEAAKLVHSLGANGLMDYMVQFARVILKKAPVLCGLGILENACDETYKLMAASPQEFDKVDRELLQECKRILPTLPVREVDILIVEHMGKDISGTGMDTNIVGGIKGYNKGEYRPPNLKKIMVLDLTEETRGNAFGIGLAHLTTKRLYDKIDFDATYTNTITTTFLDRARLPMVAKSDKEAIDIALKTIWNLPGTRPRIIIMRNTLKLDEIYVSEAIWEEIRNQINIRSISGWEKLEFDHHENLVLKI